MVISLPRAKKIICSGYDGFADNSQFLMFNTQLGISSERSNNSKLRIQNSKLTKRDSLALYNSMQLSSVASVTDNLIEWGKWSWGNTCLLNQVDNLHMENGIFRDGECGYKISVVDSTFCENVFAKNIFGENGAGIFYINVGNGEIVKNIVIDNFNGIQTKHFFIGQIKCNYILFDYNGIKIWDNNGVIINNLFENNEYSDINFTLNHDFRNTVLEIKYNEFFSKNSLIHFHDSSFNVYDEILLEGNNFYSDNYFIYLYGTYNNDNMDKSINVRNSYFVDCYSVDNIEAKIYDKDDEQDCYRLDVIIEDFNTSPFSEAGLF